MINPKCIFCSYRLITRGIEARFKFAYIPYQSVNEKLTGSGPRGSDPVQRRYVAFLSFMFMNGHAFSLKLIFEKVSSGPDERGY
jgi:hypothetical protein